MIDQRATLARLTADLTERRVSSVALTEACLERIEDSAGEGRRSIIRPYRTQALAAAASSDRLRSQGVVPSPLAGIPISIKDLFDVAGEPTAAGSVISAAFPKADRDALVVRRLRAAGAVIVGKSNMTEFAYSALGLNPHYGTPKNPVDPSRIPGGSSSGASAAVVYGCCAASIGSDTGGSVRIPAAFCGLVGLKPTQNHIPRDGTFPLSPSLDSLGPLAPSVACCALLDGIMAGAKCLSVVELPLAGLRFAIPTRYLIDGLDAAVAQTFDRALSRLSAAGARLCEQDFTEFDALEELEALGGLIAPEAFAVHRGLLAQHRDRYDPRVRSRLEAAAKISAADYIAAGSLRSLAIERFDRSTRPFDAVLAPTVPVVPPRFAEVESDAEYFRINRIVRRNASAFNSLDRCALTLPCRESNTLPVGLMVVGERNQDARLHSIGLAIERCL
jgi:aspartyl-tRNA(Asn)/glutamyl-tRNA(Gln) amidotransferase subunit A